MPACSNSIDGSASEMLLVSNVWLIAGTRIRGRDCACYRQSVALIAKPRYV